MYLVLQLIIMYCLSLFYRLLLLSMKYQNIVKNVFTIPQSPKLLFHIDSFVQPTVPKKKRSCSSFFNVKIFFCFIIVIYINYTVSTQTYPFYVDDTVLYFKTNAYLYLHIVQKSASYNLENSAAVVASQQNKK